MAQRSPWMRWTWGLSVTGVFAWSWLILWGLIPGTPAADEIAVDADVRFSIERESNDLLAGVLPGSVSRSDLTAAGTLTIREDGDFTIIRECPNLRRLRIVRVSGNELRPGWRLRLESTPQKLEALSCSYTQVNSLSQLPLLPNLQDFSAIGTPLESFEGLQQAPNLWYLSLSATMHKPWQSEAYSRHRFLPSTVLSGRPYSLEPLRKLRFLKTLRLRGRSLEQPALIWKKLDLQELDLGQTGIDSVAGIEALQGLAHLEIDTNDIADLSPLLGLPNLKEVALMGNPVTEANIATFTALEAQGVTILDHPRGRR